MKTAILELFTLFLAEAEGATLTASTRNGYPADNFLVLSVSGITGVTQLDAAIALRQLDLNGEISISARRQKIRVKTPKAAPRSYPCARCGVMANARVTDFAGSVVCNRPCKASRAYKAQFDKLMRDSF